MNDDPMGADVAQGEGAEDAGNPPSDEGTLLDQAASPEDGQEGQGNEGSEGEGSEPPEENEKKEPEGAPEEYEDFSAPEGTSLDKEVTDAFSGAAKKLNLSQSQAQALLDEMGPVLAQRSVARIQAVSAEWRKRSMEDAEFGGRNLRETSANLARLRDTFGKGADGKIDPDIAEFMGGPMGNHPGCLRLLSRIGKAFGEAKYPTGGPADGKYTAEDFYKDSYEGGK